MPYNFTLGARASLGAGHTKYMSDRNGRVIAWEPAVVLRCLSLLAGACVIAPASTTADAPPRESGADRLLAAALEPLELARAAQALGDDALLRLMGQRQPVDVRLGGLRAAPYMTHPLSSLGALVRALGGRDAVLAEAAADALQAISPGIHSDALARFELPRGELAGVRELLAGLRAGGLLRADWVLTAARVDEQLELAGVPVR